MRRPPLLLAGLLCAVALAVLLRTASSSGQPSAELAVAEQHAEQTAPTEVALALPITQDCALALESAALALSADAAPPFPLPPSDAAAIAVALAADERRVAFPPESDFGLPRTPVCSARIQIRPPPPTHIA